MVLGAMTSGEADEGTAGADCDVLAGSAVGLGGFVIGTVSRILVTVFSTKVVWSASSVTTT